MRDAADRLAGDAGVGYLLKQRTADVERLLVNATAQLTPRLKDQPRGIRWREVYEFRNIAAHAYLDIDLERVWRS